MLNLLKVTVKKNYVKLQWPFSKCTTAVFHFKMFKFYNDLTILMKVRSQTDKQTDKVLLNSTLKKKKMYKDVGNMYTLRKKKKKLV